MALWLLARRRDLVVPRGFGLWVLFLVLVVASFSQLQSANGLFTAAYRLSLYLSATVLFVYVLNTEAILSSRSVVYALTFLWVFIVIGGFLGTLMPDRTIRSPVEILLTRHLPNVQFVTDLTATGPVCVNSAPPFAGRIDPEAGSLLVSLRLTYGDTADRIVVRGLGLLLRKH